MLDREDFTTSVVIVDGKVHREHTVQHKFLSSGPIGLLLIPRGGDPQALRGVVVAERTDPALPDEIQVGMCLEKVNGAWVVDASWNTIEGLIAGSLRPLSLTFRSTVEHVVLAVVEVRRQRGALGAWTRADMEDEAASTWAT